MSDQPDYTQEFFIYILFEPKAIDFNPPGGPAGFLGVSPHPLKAYQTHLDRAGGQQQPGQWIQQMQDLCEAKPTMKILESVRSAYTRNDKYSLLEIWRWVATASGFQLQAHNIDVDNGYDRLLSMPTINRLFSLRFSDDVRYCTQVTTHEDDHDSIQPLFGHTLITVDEQVLTFPKRSHREKVLQEVLEQEEDWKVPENPEQREKHLEIIDERAKRQHPAILAKQYATSIFKQANSWTELKQGLWKWRWTVHRSPRGAVLFDGKYPTRLKDIHPEFALENLEQRFGESL